MQVSSVMYAINRSVFNNSESKLYSFQINSKDKLLICICTGIMKNDGKIIRQFHIWKDYICPQGTVTVSVN